MAYIPKPNSFHMNEARLQEAMEKQAKQRMLREQLDSQLAEKRVVGPDLVGVSSSAAMTATGGLTKVQLKRLQIEKEREMEATLNGTMNRGAVGMGGGFGQPGPGASTPMNGMRNSNAYSTGAFQQQPQQGMGYGNGYAPVSPTQAPPQPPSSQGYYQQQPQQQQPLGGYSQMNAGYGAPTPVASAQMSRGMGGYNQQPGLVGNAPAMAPGGYYGQAMTPGGAAQGSLLPQLVTQPSRPVGQQAGFNNTYTRPSPSPPYEVREESIYAHEESKENKHRDLMAIVGRVTEIDSSAGAGATTSAQVKLKSVVSGQRVQPQQQQRIPPSPREAVEPEVVNRARPGAPAAGGKPRERDRERERERDYPQQSPATVSPTQGRVSDGSKESGVPRRTDSREPGQRRLKQVDTAEKAKAQRLEKELVNHQNQVEKLREREKDWESQVARLKAELKQARLKEKHTRAQEGVQPPRAETAPNDATKTVKKPHHVKPLEELQAGAGPRPSGAAGGRRHLNDTVKYDDDGSFRPITAPIPNDLTSSTGGKSVPSFAQAALPPLTASRDAFAVPSKLDRTAPPPPPPPPPEATPASTTSPLSPSSIGSGGPRFLSVDNLKSVVTSRVITATQAEALWELFTGRPLSLVPTPPPMPPKSDANAGGRFSQTYTRPQGSMGVRASSSNQEPSYNPRTPPPDDIPEAVNTYETFDSFDAGAAPRDEDDDEEGEEGDEEEADEDDGSDEGEASEGEQLQRQYDKAYRDLGNGKQKR